MSQQAPAPVVEVASPTILSPTLEALTMLGIGEGAQESQQVDDLADDTKSPVSDAGEATKSEGTRRHSTVKHRQETTDSSGAPLVRRPPLPPHRRSSRYSQMTQDYFETIPAEYNALASWFTWILLAGFVVGPSAQQAALGVSTNETYQKVVTKVPLLVISIACSGVGALGMIGLWYRWRTNYLWLVHKIFLPGLLNGLAGTLSAAVNIWAIQGGHFRFNAPAIITISITGGSTVICLILTFVYQLSIRSVKRQHQRETGNEGDPEAPKLATTVSENETVKEAKTSIFSALFGDN